MRSVRWFLTPASVLCAGAFLLATPAAAEGSTTTTTVVPAPAVPAMPSLPPLTVPTLVPPSLPTLSVPTLNVPTLSVPALPELTVPSLPAPVLPPLPNSGSGVKASGSGVRSSSGTSGTAGSSGQTPASPQALLDVLRAGQAEETIELTPPQEANTSTGRLPVKTFAMSGLGAMLLFGAVSAARRRRDTEVA
jgi:hypothetical protein